MKASRAVLGMVFLQGVAAAQTTSAPQFVGHLAGPGAPQAQPGLRLYGTDGGWTFEHRGQVVMLFGDSWPDSNLPCETPPLNDDAQGILPLHNPGGIPPLFFQTKASSPQDFDPVQLIRGTTSLPMGFGKLPGTGFSDGRNAVAVIGTADLNRCASDGSCPDGSQAVCSQEVGDCTPQIGSIGLPCDLATGFGCFQGQTCTLTTGYCVDRTSSQSDGTQATDVFAITQNVDFGVQRPSSPVIYDSAERFPTNKFLNPTSRTVRRFTFTSHANDYRSGHDAVLIWGRPGFSGEQGRQDQLYLMALELPIPTDSSGQFPFSSAVLHRNAPGDARAAVVVAPSRREAAGDGWRRERQPARRPHPAESDDDGVPAGTGQQVDDDLRGRRARSAAVRSDEHAQHPLRGIDHGPIRRRSVGAVESGQASALAR
jgi:hypothetical protein